MAGTSFIEIYTMAISEIQDPNFKMLFESNVLLFTRAMSNFMDNAIASFSRPIGVRKRLAVANQPYDLHWEFIGDGVTKEFVLFPPPSQSDLWNIVFRCKVDGKQVPVEYDEQLSAVVFQEEPEDGSKVVVECGFVGNFVHELYLEEKSLLAQWVMVCWSEYIRNNRLDIDRLLNDTEFKLTSSASSTQSKTVWFIVNRETVEKKMLQYAWEAKITGIYR